MHFSLWHRIDDILADSDSELENDILMDDETKPEQKTKKKNRARDDRYIREDVDHIVDLADINAMSKITCAWLFIFSLSMTQFTQCIFISRSI